MKYIVTTGKRKKSIARATIREGTGIIRVNNVLVENVQPEILKLKLQEPLELGADVVAKVNVDVIAKGGGISGQADASRQAIAKGLVAWSKNEKLKAVFIKYDRNLLTYDPRRTEPHKESRSSQGPRSKRQSSKR